MYTVFGFDLDCCDFKEDYDSFVTAIKAYRDAENAGCTVFFKRGTVGTCLFV